VLTRPVNNLRGGGQISNLRAARSGQREMLLAASGRLCVALPAPNQPRAGQGQHARGRGAGGFSAVLGLLSVVHRGGGWDTRHAVLAMVVGDRAVIKAGWLADGRWPPPAWVAVR